MRARLGAACALIAMTAAACGGGSPDTSSPLPNQRHASGAGAALTAATSNVVADPGFESGGFSAGWSRCGSAPTHAAINTGVVHSGTYSVQLGAASSPEINGTEGVCQTVTVPQDATLTFWVYEGTNDTVTYADQEADLLNASGARVAQLYKEASNARSWVQKSFNLSAYAGQTLTLFFAAKGNGWSGGYVYEHLDDVSLTGSGGATPTPLPTSSPTASPTASPTSSPYPCNDPQFVTYQQEFGRGSIAADQFVDVCGTVTQVLPAKTTASGRHGYFYVSIPGAASPGTIEIVSNLDAMAQAPTNDPPSTWPWVAVGQYVYVQGRYYYDNSSSQGIDWTEDDTSGSWPHVGWVVVCGSAGGSCAKYW